MRRCARLLLAPLGALVLLVVLAPSPAGASSTTLATGAVRGLAAPGMALVAPADGRLRGPQFRADVLGVAWPGDTAPVTASRLVPAGDDRLVLFTLRLTEFAPGLLINADLPPVSADLTYGASAAAVPLGGLLNQIDTVFGTSGTGTATFVASVPIHEHAVDLTLSEAGFSQSFSLWTLRRLAPSPTVLYRAPQATTLPAATSPSGHLELSDATTHFRQPALVSTTSADLSYFAPGGTGATPPSPQALLVVQLEADASRGSLGYYLYSPNPLAGDRLVLDVPGQVPVTATPSAMLSTSTAGTDDGLLDATYSFVVPADLTSATLEITPGPTPGVQYEVWESKGPSTIEIDKGASLVFRFPPPLPVTTQRPVHWPSAPAAGASVSTNGRSASATARRAPPAGGPPWPLVLAIVLAALGLVVSVVRSRWGSQLLDRLLARIAIPMPATATATATTPAGAPATRSPRRGRGREPSGPCSPDGRTDGAQVADGRARGGRPGRGGSGRRAGLRHQWHSGIDRGGAHGGGRGRCGKKVPSVYLGEMATELGATLRKILESHGLPAAPDGPLSGDDYEEFLRRRLEYLTSELSIAVGGPEEERPAATTAVG